MYKIKLIITTDSKINYQDCSYDGDRFRFMKALNGKNILEIYSEQGETIWLNPANVVSVELYKSERAKNNDCECF